MTKKDILTVANKILGIYLLIRALEMLQIIGMSIATLSELSLDERMSGIWFLTGNIVPFLLLIVVGLCLIKWAGSIATTLCARDRNEELKGNIGRDVLQEVAFSAVGVFVIANALPRITTIIIGLSYQEKWGKTYTLATKGSIIGFVIQLAIGIFLVFGSKGLVGLLKGCREGFSKIKGL